MIDDVELIPAPASGGRVLWSGRLSQDAGGLDAYNCDRYRLLRLLDDATELVVLDVPSFPWEVLRPSDRDIPLVVVFPQHYSLEALQQSLSPMLDMLTPFDRVLEPRADIRAAIGRYRGLDPSTWLDVTDGSDAAILAAVHRQTRAALAEVETDFGVLVAPRDDLVTEHLRTFGAHQRGTLNVVYAVLDEDSVVFDIGAHIGTFTIPIARRAARGRLIAIEASPATCTLLGENVVRTGVSDRVEVVNTAVTAQPGRRVRAHSQPGNTGATAFYTTAVADPYDPPTTTIDLIAHERSLTDRVTILKLDIEGAEAAALVGASAVVDASRPMIVCEVSAAQLNAYGSSLSALDNWFTAHEYACFAITGERNTKESTWEIMSIDSLAAHEAAHFDVLAVPRESPHVDLVHSGDIGRPFDGNRHR